MEFGFEQPRSFLTNHGLEKVNTGWMDGWIESEIRWMTGRRDEEEITGSEPKVSDAFGYFFVFVVCEEDAANV